MRVRDIWINGMGVAIGRPEPIAEAVERGDYPREEAERTGQVSVAVVPATTPAVDLGVEAGRAAIRQAGVEPPGLLVHCVCHGSGCDLWSAATYVQNRLGIEECVPLEVRVGCNGLIAWEVAMRFMQGEEGHATTMVTAADTWHAPHVDRYLCASGFVWGDGGSAVLFSREPGVARVLSVCSVCDSEMEGITRGTHPLYGPYYPTLDLRARVRSYFDQVMTKREMWLRRGEGLRRAVARALAEASTRLEDIARVVTLGTGRDLTGRDVLKPLGIDLAKTTWELTRTIGHTGASDHVIGLQRLIESGAVRGGERVLVVGVGLGHSWGVAVVEVGAA